MAAQRISPEPGHAILGTADHAATPAGAQPAEGTYRALLTLRFDQHGHTTGTDPCRCGAAQPRDEERRIALLLEMDVGTKRAEANRPRPPSTHSRGAENSRARPASTGP